MSLDEIKEKFVGKWKLDRSENFEAFLAVVGVNALLRKVASKTSPTMEIRVEDDDRIKITMKMGFMNQVDLFNMDEEFLKEVQGTVMKAIVTWEDGKLKMENTPVDPKSEVKPQTVYRERIDDEIIITIHCADVICKRYMKKIGD
ncbi:hypothetical protein FSP39_022662 [Pinctada imbricata]|uniref:Cytosolic fatty-acid binding proteins domain-containing protein n=1 Tax=Pinctada imbricata TaxID=66713 RepID=A0AA88Y5T2_PINIB|nr:hypothetical protein FSP39_022662 [Pinctada imbricata]